MKKNKIIKLHDRPKRPNISEKKTLSYDGEGDTLHIIHLLLKEDLVDLQYKINESFNISNSINQKNSLDD